MDQKAARFIDGLVRDQVAGRPAHLTGHSNSPIGGDLLLRAVKNVAAHQLSQDGSEIVAERVVQGLQKMGPPQSETIGFAI